MALLKSTLIATRSLRNQIVQQESIRNNPLQSSLTTAPSVTLAWIALLVLQSHACGQMVSNHPSMTAASIALQQKLQSPCRAYVAAPLESLLEIISIEQGIPIWIDRRITKDAKIEIEKQEETIETYLARVSSSVGGALVPVDGVLMIVPQPKQASIEAAYWRLAVSRVGGALTRIDPTPFEWPEASVPSKILNEFVRRYGLQELNEAPLEYDLWKKFEFRKSSPASISVCLLSGFDLCLADENNQLKIVSLERSGDSAFDVNWVYKASEVKRIGEAYWRDWRTRWPDAVSKATKTGDYHIQAQVAAHRDLLQPLFPLKKPDTKKQGISVFSGPLKGELEIVLRSLAVQTQLEFVPLPLPPKLGSKSIDVTLNNSTIEDILKLIGNESGLEFRKLGQRVEIILP
jgi:hypothetical protein